MAAESRRIAQIANSPRTPSACMHVAAQAAAHHFAARHHQIAVRQRFGKVVILLHQQNGHLASSRQLADRRADLLDDGGLNALGRLVQHQQRRTPYQRAANRQLLLLAAGQVAAPAAAHFVKHRKHLEHAVRQAPARRAGEASQPQAQVFLHRQPRKDFAPLRHIGDAARRALMRGQRGNVLAAPEHAPAAYRNCPLRHLSSVLLPAPLRPSRQVICPVSARRLIPRRMRLPP
ncbi:hypothetical protein JOS77_25565 [Chromobacterium haemolyticum]|nr:hypothetical protein JOS77_25565 [Chromobacterium haemolyticum]